MEQTKYDVFISYSRKDYVRDDVVIPGNPITAIQEMFDQNGINYWFDKDGIYGGQEFVEVISDAIASSKMLVFVSSKHSNVSKWTAGEIFEAHDGDKLIIPVIATVKYDSIHSIISFRVFKILFPRIIKTQPFFSCKGIDC